MKHEFKLPVGSQAAHFQFDFYFICKYGDYFHFIREFIDGWQIFDVQRSFASHLIRHNYIIRFVTINSSGVFV